MWTSMNKIYEPKSYQLILLVQRMKLLLFGSRRSASSSCVIPFLVLMHVTCNMLVAVLTLATYCFQSQTSVFYMHWLYLCVFVPDTLCEAVTSPAWAGCSTVRPAEGVSSDVRLHTDYCSDVTADTSRCSNISFLNDNRTIMQTPPLTWHTHWHKLSFLFILIRIPEEDAAWETGEIHQGVEHPQSRGGKQRSACLH